MWIRWPQVATYHYDIVAVQPSASQGLRGLTISSAPLQLDWKLYLVQVRACTCACYCVIQARASVGTGRRAGRRVRACIRVSIQSPPRSHSNACTHVSNQSLGPCTCCATHTQESRAHGSLGPAIDHGH